MIKARMDQAVISGSAGIGVSACCVGYTAVEMGTGVSTSAKTPVPIQSEG